MRAISSPRKGIVERHVDLLRGSSVAVCDALDVPSRPSHASQMFADGCPDLRPSAFRPLSRTLRLHDSRSSKQESDTLMHGETVKDTH